MFCELNGPATFVPFMSYTVQDARVTFHPSCVTSVTLNATSAIILCVSDVPLNTIGSLDCVVVMFNPYVGILPALSVTVKLNVPGYIPESLLIVMFAATTRSSLFS